MQQVRDLRGVAPRLEIHGLDESIRPLALVGLGEAGDRAAQRRDGSGLIVAVLAAEARRGNQERARSGDLFIERRAWSGRAT